MKKNARYIKLAFLILVCISNLAAAGGQAKKCSVSEAREVELIAASLSSGMRSMLHFKNIVIVMKEQSETGLVNLYPYLLLSNGR
ncbi:MAG: hypothetical protein V4660_06150 [Pseudomonadota bacterium]